jgi:hypothetical protein
MLLRGIHSNRCIQVKTIRTFFSIVRSLLTLLLAVSFIGMVVNVTLFYGFVPSMIHTTGNHSDPFGLTIPLIWIIHLTVGFFAGMVFTKKRFLLAGCTGLLCAFLVTGISVLYFGWRESISTVEVLIPLIFGILPPVKLYDYITGKFPLKEEQETPTV